MRNENVGKGDLMFLPITDLINRHTNLILYKSPNPLGADSRSMPMPSFSKVLGYEYERLCGCVDAVYTHC